MVDRTREIKDNIVQLLKECGEMFTKDIANKINVSPATTSKYLGILHAEGKVIKSDARKPYINWRVKDTGK